MRSGLFWRFFSAILAVLLVTIVLFTAILVTVQRDRMQATYETEVRMQARQVAEYMQQANQLSYIRGNATIQKLLNDKINAIYDQYNADIWLVSYSTGRVQYIDRSWNTSESLATDAVLNTLSVIQSGMEIRETGLFSELGDHIVTIGVPWTYSNGPVVGAVLLHIPVERLRISYLSVLPQAMLPAGVSAILGIILAFVVTRSQISPLREINSAVRDFTKGNLSRRVELNCGGELEDLGNSINDMATELSSLEESRRSFVANVSHELRSPMTSIKGYIQAMLDGTISVQDQPRYLNVVLDETNRLTDLVRDLLDLSRLESGKFPMQISAFDANEMMRRNLIRFEQRIDEKGLNVDIQFADDPCRALGDVSRINQVLTNFIDNAVKFMNGPTGCLTLRTERVEKGVRFCVQDNGPGISPRDLPRITERFYKADKAHTSGMGTGLGLSICKNILMQHNCSLEVESQEGRTVFSFVLPAAEPAVRTLPETQMRQNEGNPA